MQLKGNRTRYGSLAAGLHWISAILIVVTLALGLRAASIDDPAAKLGILRAHVILADIVLVLTVIRLLWWALDIRPAPVSGIPRLQVLGSKAVHIAIYGAIVILGASGIAMIILSDIGPALFGAAPADPTLNFWEYPPRGAHRVAALGLFGLLVLHVGAALHHHFVRRDGLIGRMRLFG